MILHSWYHKKIVYRQFHTSAPRHVHPVLWIFLKPALKLAALLTGRTTRKWYQQLPAEKRSIFFQHLNRHKYKYAGIVGTLTSAVYLHYYTHLETSEISGRRRYIMMSADQIAFLTELEKEKIVETYNKDILPADSKQTQLVARVAGNLIVANKDIAKIKEVKWTVRVIDIDMQNAFVLPSGDIFATRGMLDIMTNEDQLAVILGHELAHALLDHSAEKLSYAQAVDVVAIFCALVIWTVFPSDFTSFFVQYIFEKFIKYTTNLPYSRKLEEEADHIGLMLAAKACYDVRESAAFWAAMHAYEKDMDIPEFMSTHPSNDKRAESLKNILPQALDKRRQCNCASLPENKQLGVLKLPAPSKKEAFDATKKEIHVLQAAPTSQAVDKT